MVEHICNPSTWEAVAGGSHFQVALHSKTDLPGSLSLPLPPPSFPLQNIASMYHFLKNVIICISLSILTKERISLYVLFKVVQTE